MGSPAFLFRDLYTAAELQTMLRELATTGQITSLSGAAKSSSFSRLDPMQLGIELRAELNRLTGRTRAQKVQSRFYDTGYEEGGTVTTP